jgi:hypothetical protein
MGMLVTLTLVFATSSVFAKEEMKPDATIDFKTKQVSIIVGLGWGSGTVKYKGKEYAVKARGFQLGSVGVSASNMTGYIYNLNKIEDVEGSYTTVGIGAAVGTGASSVRTKNDKGVVMDVWSTDKGVKVTIGASGVTLDLVGKGKDYSPQVPESE